nr:pheromone olfactory receptor 2 [Cnaphalocrocis medinalis]
MTAINKSGQRTEDPMTLKYMKLIRSMLITVGLWPGEAVAGKPHRIPFANMFITWQSCFCIYGELLFIYRRFRILSFFVLGDVCIAFSLTMLNLVRAVFPYSDTYGAIFHDFVSVFHLKHFKHKSEYARKTCETVDRISYYFSLYMTVIMVIGVSSFNLTPQYHNYQNGIFKDDAPENITIEFAVYYSFPYFEQEDHIAVSNLYNVFLSYICAVEVCILDLFLCVAVFQTIGHIHTLVNTLRSFPGHRKLQHPVQFRKSVGADSGSISVEIIRDFDDEENKIIKKLIKECVEHHFFIVSFTERLSKFFGPLLGFNYMYQTFCLCILLLQCMGGGGALMRYAPLTLITFGQLLQFSVTFEIVGAESEKLKDEVYYLPWESMSVSNQKSVCFLLSRVQTPIMVTAFGMTPVGVQTMGGILKTTFSYCAFLGSLQ